MTVRDATEADCPDILQVQNAAYPEYPTVTGVLPAHRGRRIAMALKLATIAYGQAHGRTGIRTWNEEHNTAILAINDRRGFVRQPAWLSFEKSLTLVPAR